MMTRRKRRGRSLFLNGNHQFISHLRSP